MKNLIRARFLDAMAEGKSIEEATAIGNDVHDGVYVGNDDMAPTDDIPLTDDELREAIKVATGKAPHWKTNRPGLIKQYQALENAS